MKTLKIDTQDYGSGYFEVRENTFDEQIVKEVWEDLYYFANDYKIPKGATVIDIGGHIGTFAILAINAGAKRVLTFEPNNENFEMLKQNISLNGYEDRIEAYDIAVTVKTGKFGFTPLRLENGLLHTGGSGISETGIVTVYGRSFVSIMKDIKYCDVLKLDIEGYEYELLYSAPDWVFENIGMITMEFHWNIESECKAKGEELLKFLETKGFNGEIAWTYGTQGRLQAKK